MRALALVLFAGCGTLAPTGGGADDLPVSGAGPYRPLVADDATAIAEPVVMADPLADLDDCFLLARGELLGTWMTRTTGGHSEIRHADFLSLEEGPISIDPSLAADQLWEQESVAQPVVLEPLVDFSDPWILIYAANGAIGYATALDGHTWVKAPGPALAPTAEEGALDSPTALPIGDGAVRLIYHARGGLYAADATRDALGARAAAAFTRVGLVVADGAEPWLPGIGRSTARRVITAAGRARYDLFLTGSLANLRVVGFAGSFDGGDFSVAQAPFLDAHAPEEWAPTAVAYRAGSLLFHSLSRGSHSVIAGATSP